MRDAAEAVIPREGVESDVRLRERGVLGLHGRVIPREGVESTNFSVVSRNLFRS
jgi:hypothetical protein